MIADFFKWLLGKEPAVCGICGMRIKDKDYDLIYYKIQNSAEINSAEIQQMNICSKCKKYIDDDHKKFKEMIDKNKD